MGLFDLFKRAKPAPAPQRRAYSAAKINRLTADWITQATSGDAEIRGSLRILRDRCRQLERDNDWVKSFLRELQNNVVGQGVRMQGQAQMQRGSKLNEKMNAAMESAWQVWCKKQTCNTAGKLSFWEMERMLIRTVARDGEIIFRKIYQEFGNSKTPFALEVIEADLLDDSYNGTSGAGNEIRMGVELDQWSRPVNYYFLRYHPGDYPLVGPRADQGPRHVVVPAADVEHLFIAERPNQTRGVPWLCAALIRLRHMQGYEEAEVIAARATAAIMGFVQSPEAEAESDGVEGADRLTDFEPGVFKYLAPGETVTVPTISRPGGQFTPFVKQMLRAVAASIGISYEGLSKDFSESNYSSARLSLINDRDNWRTLQRWMIDNFHQPVFETWIEISVLAGVLKIPDFETNAANYEGVRWQTRGWAWVDPQKEITAYREAILGGLTSATKVAAQEGEDINDLYAEISSERKLAESLDLVFDTDAKNGITPSNIPPKPGADEQPQGNELK